MEIKIKTVIVEKIIITESQLEIFFGLRFICFFVIILFPISIGVNEHIKAVAC